MKITLQEAIRLSKIKWEILSKSKDFNKVKSHNELKDLNFNCGFCERHKAGTKYDRRCNQCEFGNYAGICNNTEENLYEKWYENYNTYYAKKIYKVLLQMESDYNNGTLKESL